MNAFCLSTLLKHFIPRSYKKKYAVSLILFITGLFVRKNIMKLGAWRGFLTVCTCATISVFYEFLEWLVAVFSGESSDAFLGTQGYVWDTQSDMLCACIGATCTVLFFAGIQDKAIAKLG